jgi:hypothetical protein
MALYALTTSDLDHLPPPLARADDAVADRPSWMALRYAAADEGSRSATRRRLKAIAAINLQNGTWALPSSRAATRAAPHLVDDIRDAGGNASIDLVVDASPANLRLGSMLDRACERLWDDFFNHVDWYRIDRPGPDQPLAAHVAALAPLFDLFAVTVGKDIAASSALLRAEATLDGLLGDLTFTDGAERWWPDRRPVHHAIDLVASWTLCSGRVAVVAAPRPRFDPRFVATLQRFEARTYRPSPLRAPLRGGAFRFAVEPDGVEDALAGLQRRLDWFEATLR